MELKIYSKDFKEVERVAKGEVSKIPFGIVRKILALVESAQDTEEAISALVGTSDSLMLALSITFPDITDEEWDYTDTEEVVAVAISIVTSLVDKFGIIPKSKND